MTTFIRLAPTDAQEYHHLRLAGLLQSPLAFRSSHADEVGRSLAEVVERLTPTPDGSVCVFGARLHSRIKCVLTFNRPRRAKLSHGGELTGMYVAPELRRRGVAGRYSTPPLLTPARYPGFVTCG